MKVQKKLCSGCQSLQYIWSSRGGRKLCKQCASSNTGVAKLSIKPTAKKPIPPRSQKRSKEERLYTAKRILFLTTHSLCEAHLPEICTGMATECHHMAGRTGDNYLDISKWKALCHNCHCWCTDHPKEAIELGFSLKRIN